MTTEENNLSNLEGLDMQRSGQLRFSSSQNAPIPESTVPQTAQNL
jgi:hypothetical protein